MAGVHLVLNCTIFLPCPEPKRFKQRVPVSTQITLCPSVLDATNLEQQRTQCVLAHIKSLWQCRACNSANKRRAGETEPTADKHAGTHGKRPWIARPTLAATNHVHLARIQVATTDSAVPRHLVWVVASKTSWLAALRRDADDHEHDEQRTAASSPIAGEAVPHHAVCRKRLVVSTAARALACLLAFHRADWDSKLWGKRRFHDRCLWTLIEC